MTITPTWTHYRVVATGPAGSGPIAQTPEGAKRGWRRTDCHSRRNASSAALIRATSADAAHDADISRTGRTLPDGSRWEIICTYAE